MISKNQNQQKSKSNSKTKEIYHRALRACPWSKELYLLGMEELVGYYHSVNNDKNRTEKGKGNGNANGGLTYEELRGTWRVMGEKECRVHVDLEDAFEEIGEVGDGKVRKVGGV